MWRDPLDELIDDLESVAPDRPSAWAEQFLRLQELTDTILYGTPDRVAAIRADPKYQRWVGRSSAARADLAV